MELKTKGRTTVMTDLIVRNGVSRPDFPHLGVDLLILVTELTHTLQGIFFHARTYRQPTT